MRSNSEVTEVPCLGCGRNLRYPAGKARASRRKNRYLVVFCSKRCQMKYQARTVEKQMRDNYLREVGFEKSDS